jgi:hypothetical protein
MVKKAEVLKLVHGHVTHVLLVAPSLITAKPVSGLSDGGAQ